VLAAATADVVGLVVAVLLHALTASRTMAAAMA